MLSCMRSCARETISNGKAFLQRLQFALIRYRDYLCAYNPVSGHLFFKCVIEVFDKATGFIIIQNEFN